MKFSERLSFFFDRKKDLKRRNKMIKIFRYLKSSIVSILAIILLLFVQAWCDLTLPEYTSRIVNVGVQQSGIENAAIQVVGETTLNRFLLFLDEEDQKYILSSYEKKGTYHKEQLFHLKEHVNEEKVSELLKKPMLIISYSSSEEASKMLKLPAGADLFEMLEVMPVEQKEKMMKQVDENLKKIPDTIMDQAAISFVKTELIRVGVDTDQMQTNYIFITGAKMLGLALIIMLDGILIVFIGSKMAARLAKTLREKIFHKILDFSKTEMKELGSSSLITRTTNDIQQVQGVIVFLLRVVFYAPIIAVGGLIKAMNTNASMTYIIGIAVFAISVLVIFMFGIAMPKMKKMQKMVDKINQVTREILTGLPVVRAFSNEKHEEKRFDQTNDRLTKVTRFIGRTMSFMMPAMMFIMNMICILIVWKGANGVDSGTMQVGDIMAYIQYTMQIIMAFLMISMMSIMLPRASVSAKRINEVLEHDIAVEDPKQEAIFDPKKKGVVEFQNVCFRYPDADYDVLTDINFKATPGHTVAFIGSTGSGKSTVVNLIPRFFDVTKGKILVDGVDIRDVKTSVLRDKIGFVPQKGVLFTGTIESNIKYGNDEITDEMMIESARIAQATEFISSKELSYQDPISQGGTNVSGGQKQRLAIARALAKDPDIFIFDDSFSALDFKTDATLRRELAGITKDKTVLIVAQRISTIMNADLIIVLDEGKIAGTGTHQDLMKTCDVYREIALSQLSKEELDYE